MLWSPPTCASMGTPIFPRGPFSKPTVKVFPPHRTWEQFEAFSQALLAESARILGTTQGYLFHVPYPHAPIRLVAVLGGKLESVTYPYASLPDLMELVAEGAPLILDNVQEGGWGSEAC